MLKVTQLASYLTLGATYLAPQFGVDKALCQQVGTAAYLTLASLVLAK